MRALRLVAIVLLVSACSATPPLPPDADSFEAHRATLTDLQQWSFSGRIAVQSASGADSASLKWEQNGDDIRMALSGPVGIKEAILTRREGRLTLERNGEQQVLAPAEDPLLAEFGWTLPLNHLPYWLRGLPDPDLPIEQQTTTGGRLSVLNQAGWALEYRDYQEVSGRALPRRISFSRADVSGKILLKEWQL